MGIRIFIFLSGELLCFFLDLCDYSDKILTIRAVGNTLQPQISVINVVGNLIESGLSKAASSVDKEKQLKEYFHRRYAYASIVSLLEKRHGVRMHVPMLKRKLKNRPRKLRPVRRCFPSTFTLITCRSLIILSFIYARKASQKYKCVNYEKFKRQWKSTIHTYISTTPLVLLLIPYLFLVTCA